MPWTSHLDQNWRIINHKSPEIQAFSTVTKLPLIVQIPRVKPIVLACLFLLAPFLSSGQSQSNTQKAKGLIEIQFSPNLTQLRPSYLLNGAPVPYVSGIRSWHGNADISLGVKLIEMNRLYVGYSSPVSSDSIFSYFNQHVSYRSHSFVFVNRLSVYKNFFADFGLNYMRAISANQFNSFGEINLLLEPDFRKGVMQRILAIGYDQEITEHIRFNITLNTIKSLQSLDLDPNQNLSINSHEISFAFVVRN